MAIGKNAIKRVENNGYSKVKSTAPDMENSEVVVAVEPAPAVVEFVPAPVKSAEKKPAAKKPTAKKPAAKKAPVKKAGKSVEPAISLGQDLPFYLL